MWPNSIKKNKGWCRLGILLCFSAWKIIGLNAQDNVYGIIKDEVSKQPLSFAAVVVKDSPNGSVTDLNGKFQLTHVGLPVTISISLIGYETMDVNLEKPGQIIFLHPKAYQLREAQIRPGINPADAIIKRVIEKRDSLNPKHLNTYSYHSYNKLIVTGRKDTIVNPLAALLGNNDTLSAATEYLFSRQHIFINESVNEKKYKKPGNYHETILATRTSGMKDPIFSTITTQLQSFSFYENRSFQILSTEYNNPLSDDAFTNYNYQIQDTTFSGYDTVIVISFSPKKGKNYKGLKGVLYVNKQHYALERASASPVKTDQLQLEVQHIYKRTGEGVWFPLQLNTDMIIKRPKIGNHNMVVEARTYIKEIKLNPELKNREFGALEVEVSKDAIKNYYKILPPYRETDLDKKDSTTYTTIDSLGQQLKIDKQIEFLEAALDGKIRVSVLDFPVDKVITYNNYEGIRLGLAIETNHRMLKWMRLGGYFAYGFNDKAFKYGGFVEFIPVKKHDLRIRFDYKRDVRSSGFTDFPIAGPLQLTAATSQLVLNVFDSLQLFEGSISVKPFLNWQLKLSMSHQQLNPTYQYRYLPDTNFHPQYNLTEIELTTRWAIKEKYIALASRYLAKPTKYPILHLHITQSLPTSSTAFSYTKLLGRIQQTFYIKKLGKSSFMLEGGYIFGDAPYAKLFANRGYFADFSIISRSGFETMRSNEFLMDSYVALFFHHNFGTLFRVKKFIRPELSIMHNFGFGWLQNPSRHEGVTFKTMKHGFFEAGIIIDNMLVLSNVGFGFGTFYRYGSTASGDPLQNFYFKMALSAAL